jgi:hypothetical protein
MGESQGGKVVKSEQNEWVKCNVLNAAQSQEIIALKERINRLEELAEELAYEDCAASRKDIWQGFKESQ